MNDCSVVLPNATWNSHATNALIEAPHLGIHGCFFDLSDSTPDGSHIKVIRGPSGSGGGDLSVTGNIFTETGSGAGLVYAITWSGALVSDAVSASGNTFGNNVTPYGAAYTGATGNRIRHAIQPCGGQEALSLDDPNNSVECDTNHYTYFYVTVETGYSGGSFSVLLGDPIYQGQKAHVVIMNKVVAGTQTFTIEGASPNTISSTVNVVVTEGDLDVSEYATVAFEVMYDDDAGNLAWVAYGKHVNGHTL
jgi:hypothetical protein